MQPILEYKICQNCACSMKLSIFFDTFEYFSKLYTTRKLYCQGSYLQMALTD